MVSKDGNLAFCIFGRCGRLAVTLPLSPKERARCTGRGDASAPRERLFKVFDAFMEFAGQGLDASGWNIAKRPAKELLPKGIVSSLYVSELLIGVGADFLLEQFLSLGTSGPQ